MYCSEMGEKREYLGNDLASKVLLRGWDSLKEDDDQFDLHFFFAPTLKVICVTSAGLAALISGDPKHVSCSSL